MTMSPTYLIVRKMIEAGNSQGPIRQLLEAAKAWADANVGQDAAALRTWLPVVRTTRPFYTAAELAPLWPAVKLVHGLERRMTEPPSPNRLANELKFHGLPVLLNEHGGRYFKFPAENEFFVVEHCHKWREARLTQEEFEEIQNG